MNLASTVLSAKAALRTAATAERDRLDAVTRAAASEAIAQRALAIVTAEAPRVMAAYLPIRSECDSRPIIAEALARSITIALPVQLDRTTMVFRRYVPDAPLAHGGFGTSVPMADQPILDPDLVIVPLVGFDRAGTRLGYGRGYYDRALAKLAARGIKPKLLGVAFAAQEVAAIPVSPHDVRLDWIVTENETLWVASQGSGR